MIPPLLALVLALLGLGALGVVALPLLRRGRPLPSRPQFDRAVYRDQLQEVERDRARGLLDDTEAASARLEIERRLLATAEPEPKTAPRRPRPTLAAAVVVVALAWAGGLYLTIGRPGLPDLPFAARHGEGDATAGRRDIEAAATRLQAALEANGGDAAGWLLLARTDTALRRWDASAEAYQRAIALVPDADKPTLQAAYGEMQVLAAEGIVTPAAADTFRATLKGAPANRVARYYLALGDAQAGESRRAIDSWLKLAGELPADSLMRAEIARRIADAAQAAGIAIPDLPPAVAAETKP